jgi:hypothetical protein
MGLGSPSREHRKRAGVKANSRRGKTQPEDMTSAVVAMDGGERFAGAWENGPRGTKRCGKRTGRKSGRWRSSLSEKWRRRRLGDNDLRLADPGERRRCDCGSVSGTGAGRHRGSAEMGSALFYKESKARGAPTSWRSWARDGGCAMSARGAGGRGRH